jgi:hypothetical protein
MRCIRGFVSVLVLLASASALADPIVSLRASTVKLPRERRSETADAYFASYGKALNCEYLKRYYPQWRKDVLELYESEEISFKLLPYDPEFDAQCAYVYGSWFSGNTIRLRPLAYTSMCFNLKSVIFHEMLHLAYFWTDEDTVTEIEVRCLKF